jgi:hypothetical protein
MKTRAPNFLLALFSLGALSCYSPDLTTQIYQCDRGRCPEDFYCIDTKYCTQVVPNCQMGGIELREGVAVCVGAKTPGDANTICAMGFSTATCDTMMVQTTLCTGPGLEATNCAYCCK